MPSKLFRLQIVELPVTNVKASAEWYTEMFGIGYCFPYHEGDDEAWLNVNGLGLGLIRSEVLPKMDFVTAKGERKPCFTFQVDNIKELHEEMIQKGVEVQELVYKQGGGCPSSFVYPSNISDLVGVPN